MDDLKAEIEALPVMSNCGTNYVARHSVLALLATHAADPAPVAVEDALERIFVAPWMFDTPLQNPVRRKNHDIDGDLECIRADLAHPSAAPTDELPWRDRDIKRGLILFRTSSNAHDFINFSILSEKVDSLNEHAKVELADCLRAVAEGIKPAAPTDNTALVEALEEAKQCLDGEPEYHQQGMGCGLEDRNITDRYEAMEYGWDQAMERVYGEHINGAVEVIDAALARGSVAEKGHKQ